MIFLLSPSLLLVSVFEQSQTFLLFFHSSMKMMIFLTKTRPWSQNLNLWHWFNLDGTEKHQFCSIFPQKASSVYALICTGSFSKLLIVSRTLWDPSWWRMPREYTELLHPFCQGHVSFLSLFSSIRTVLAVREGLVQLSASSCQRLRSSGWRENLQQTWLKSKFLQVHKWNVKC